MIYLFNPWFKNFPMSTSREEKRYRETIHLPQTSFPMKANLPVQEPEWLKAWQSEGIYERLKFRALKRKNKYTLHDGPPYANGHIHIGHAFNKILKDMILRYKTMKGYGSDYVPGWDCHGLPIEHALLSELGKRKDEVDQVSFRKKARSYAERFIQIQRDEFIRLGIFGDWSHPYLTMNFEYQSKIAESFLTLYEKGFIEQRLKPVPWCFDCETALADAELEYEDKTSPSVYVTFPLAGSENISFIVWTTTPWTLPANVGLALHPELDYVTIETEKGRFVFAHSLLQTLQGKLGFKNIKEIGIQKGKNFSGRQAKHPFIDRMSRVITADYVSAEDGTGIVHIAPGHGEEDYVHGYINHNLAILSPVDSKGRFTNEFPLCEGIHVFKANPKIVELLKEKGALLHEEPHQHSYPHCWRCKKPIIFRATKQWFLKVDYEDLRTRLGKAIQNEIRFVPDTGKNRIGSMIATRPDWCLSRQRYWGVPIPIIRCQSCQKILVSESKTEIVSSFAKEGADVWFEKPASAFLKPNFACSCGSHDFVQEKDIIDVWFDSGVSHKAVLQRADERVQYPADLYLEGSDQHRGWFQSALITGVALDKKPPFHSVLTHGFVVDGEGKKMSKSRGNVVSPEEVMKEFGADVLRLWVCSSDYQFDIRLSREILTRLVESYRRIRNTFRFLLGNLHDFDARENHIPLQEMQVVDQWALAKSYLLVRDAEGYLEKNLFHHVYRLVQDYLVLDLSAFYLDILKDRLYTAGKNSTKRRSAQTALYDLLQNLVKILAPVLPFTCDEVWRLTRTESDAQSIHEADWPECSESQIDRALIQDWQDLLQVRDLVNQRIEQKRIAKEIGSALELRLSLATNDKRLTYLFGAYRKDLREAFIVSQLEIVSDLEAELVSLLLDSDGEQHQFKIAMERAHGLKCERCWTYSIQVGRNTEHLTLCERCSEAINA